ncbi:class 1 isoprenoid biosynthesis enzyme [Streptomyces thinghirensis]|nr:class 1 isoprenoid biosynthesis enzyme [Streptomyces thinghirensis]
MTHTTQQGTGPDGQAVLLVAGLADLAVSNDRLGGGRGLRGLPRPSGHRRPGKCGTGPPGSGQARADRCTNVPPPTWRYSPSTHRHGGLADGGDVWTPGTRPPSRPASTAIDCGEPSTRRSWHLVGPLRRFPAPVAGQCRERGRARQTDAGGARHWGWRAAGHRTATPLVRAAAAMELVHAAAIVHDDLIDDSGLRHGLPTAHVALKPYYRWRPRARPWTAAGPARPPGPWPCSWAIT